MESIEFYIVIGFCFLFFVVGCFGHIISMIIFNKKEFKTLPTTTYLMALNIVNTIHLVYLPFMAKPKLWTDLYPETISCQIFGGFMMIMVQIQSWIYTLRSLDRCITTLQPFKFLFKNKLKFQLAMISIVSFILICLSIPVLHFFEKQESENVTTCESKYLWSFIYFKYQFALFRLVLPFIITIFASILTIYKLITSKFRLKVRDWDNMKREYDFARSLIIMDLLFVVFRIPSSLNVGIKDNMSFLYTFLYSVFVLLGALHSVFVFWIFIAFNKVYRNLFKEIFCNKSNKVGVTDEIVIIQIPSI
jgi:hypothetical protein